MTVEIKTMIRAFFTLVGLIIGVGFFGVPYVVAQAGAGMSIFYFLILGAATILIHLMYGEVVLRTREKHRFVGFVHKYAGTRLGRLSVITSTLGFWSALLAYIILGGTFASFLFSPLFGGTEFLYQIIFFIALAIPIYFGIRLVAKAETLLTALLCVAFFVLIVFALPKIDIQNFVLFGRVQNFFLPYGVILFALSGAPAIPELRDILIGNARKKLQSVIIIGTVIATLFTALFAFVVVGTLGGAVSKDAISGLGIILGKWAIFLGSFGGLLAVATSFLVLGLNLEEQFVYDFKKNRSTALLLAIGVPFVLFLIGSRDFISIIGFAGAVFTAADSMLLVLLWVRSKTRGEREPEYALSIPKWVGWIIIFFFLLGALYEIVHVVSQ